MPLKNPAHMRALTMVDEATLEPLEITYPQVSCNIDNGSASTSASASAVDGSCIPSSDNNKSNKSSSSSNSRAEPISSSGSNNGIAAANGSANGSKSNSDKTDSDNLHTAHPMQMYEITKDNVNTGTKAVLPKLCPSINRSIDRLWLTELMGYDLVEKSLDTMASITVEPVACVPSAIAELRSKLR